MDFMKASAAAGYEPDPSMASTFAKHAQTVIEEIDEAGDIAMSTFMLGQNDSLLKLAQEHRPTLGRMVVVASGRDNAPTVLDAIVDGTTAAMERAMSLSAAAQMSP